MGARGMGGACILQSRRYNLRMTHASINSAASADLTEILEPNERLLWVGAPAFGRRFFQPVGAERIWLLSFIIGIIAMWCTLPFIPSGPGLNQDDAIWVYLAVTVFFVILAASLAMQRQYVLQNLAYYLTNRRAIVCRVGMNWRLSSRVYIISCPLSPAFSYEIIDTAPFPSLRVGTLLSEDSLQPFGSGLSHPGQPYFWGRVITPVIFELIPDAKAVSETISLTIESNDIASQTRGG